MAASPDHVALIFGASRGIGAACAHAFAARGAHVCLTARDETRLGAVAASVTARGGHAWAQTADIADPASVTAAVDGAMQAFGRIDTVVDLAAVTGALDRPTWELPPEDWQAALATNLTGPFNIIRATVPGLVRQNRGSLIFASSPFGDAGQPGMGAYAASRAGANALVRQLAAELADTGVGACLAEPGITETEGLAAFRAARGGASFGTGAAVPAELMANLFVLAALQAPQDINGLTLSWADPEVRGAVMELAEG